MRHVIWYSLGDMDASDLYMSFYWAFLVPKYVVSLTYLLSNVICRFGLGVVEKARLTTSFIRILCHN